jgi:hypothetical protein
MIGIFLKGSLKGLPGGRANKRANKAAGESGKNAAESSDPTPPKTAANLPYDCLRKY